MRMKPTPKNEKLEAMLQKAAEQVAAMTLEDIETMLRKQRDGYVRAELSWPRNCPYR